MDIPVHCSHTTMWDIEKCVPNPNNPNQHPQEQVELLSKIIKAHGWRSPITVSKRSGFVVKGHGRLLAAHRLGLNLVPVDEQGYENEAEEMADLIADNRIAELAVMNDAKLESALADLAGVGYDLELTGFDDESIEKILGSMGNSCLDSNATQDEVPSKRDTEIKRGDIFLLGRHRLMCGDSTDPIDFERLMDGELADMVFTDPPYGVSYAAKNKFLNTISRGNRIQDEIEKDHMSPDEMSIFWTKAFSLVFKHCNNISSYYVTSPQGGDLLLLLLSLKDSGAQVKHMIIWVKNNHVLGRCDYHYKHEPILYGWKEGGTHKFYGGSSKLSVWPFDLPQKSDLHPTMKPVEMVAEAISNSSTKNQIVLDVFGGSGTTLIACEKLNRKCFMMEVDPSYCQVIIDRWEGLTGKKHEKWSSQHE